MHTQTLSRLTCASLVVWAVTSLQPTTHGSVYAPLQEYMVSTNGELRGWVDMHAHPMSHLGSGGKLIHGAPDLLVLMPEGTYACSPLPMRAPNIETALIDCGPSHQEWIPVDRPCGDFLRAIFIRVTEASRGASSHHGPGYPTFSGWIPNWNDITHQKMYVEWIRRAHKAGQRVMVALCLHSSTMAKLTRGIPRLSDDRSVGNLQIQEMKTMVARHPDFMEIAYTPQDLHRIVKADKMAIILGSELDDPGNLTHYSHPTADHVRRTIWDLYSRGVRYMFLVHQTDNPLCGAAVYEDMFNMANKIQTGEWYHLMATTNTTLRCEEDISMVVAHVKEFLYAGEILNLGRRFLPPDLAPDDIVEKLFDDIWGPYLDLGDDPEIPHIDPPFTGHQNTNGLSDLGRVAVDEMMRLGMMIDIDHMSLLAVEEIMTNALARGYPLCSGHAGLGVSTNVITERDRTREQYEQLQHLEGMAAVGIGSKGIRDFIRWYQSTSEVMSNTFLALATDMNGMEMGPQPAGLFSSEALQYGNGLPRSLAGTPLDYNDVGVAHYGMLADFLAHIHQLAENRSNYSNVLPRLFQSSESFYKMWKRCRQEFWVQDGHPGENLGTEENPYNSLHKAIRATESGNILNIRADDAYADVDGVLREPRTFRADLLPVRINNRIALSTNGSVLIWPGGEVKALDPAF